VELGAMLTLCWGTVAVTTLDELAEAAAAGGFGAISATPAMALGGGRPSTPPVSYVDALLGALPGSPPLDAIQPAYRHFFEPGTDNCFRAAALTGAPVLNVAHFLGDAVPLPAMIDAFGALCTRAAREGLALTLEFIPGSGVPDLATALAIVTGTGADNAGVLVDTWHLSRSGGTVADLAAAPAGTLTAIQLSDRCTTRAEGAYVPMRDRLLPGDGDLPLSQIVATVRANSADAIVSVEVFSAALAALPPAEAAARAGAAARAALPL
jgi:sugar phosphate isomerase/epimerase